jgi:RNase P/RNase MRP subunit p29
MLKYLFLSISLFFFANLSGQEVPKKSKIFVRVYNNQGDKIAKGKIVEITENTLILKKGSKTISIPSSEITYLISKKSDSHNILVGLLAGTSLGAYSIVKSKNAFGFAFSSITTMLLATLGSWVGYLSTAFKHSKIYTFSGDAAKWKGFKEDMYSPKN